MNILVNISFVLFAFSAAALVYTSFGATLILLVIAKLKKNIYDSDSGGTFLPKVSLLISAYNEENVIERKILNSQSLDYPEELLEIIIVSDGSTDKTIEIAEKYKDSIKTLSYSDRSGKNHCLNNAIKHATGEIIVFSDANSIYNIEAVKKLAEHFYNKNIGCVVGREVRQTNNSCDQETSSDNLYWSMENRIKKIQSRKGLVLVANGSIFAIRKELFKELFNDVANDFQLPIQIGAAGYDIVYERGAIAFEKAITDYSEEFRRKVRIITRGLFGTAKLFKSIHGIRLMLFIPFKLMRWFTMHLILINFVSSVVLINRGYVFIAATCSYLLLFSASACDLMLWKFRIKIPKIFELPFFFFMVNIAAFVATIRFLQNRPVSRWNKAMSNRHNENVKDLKKSKQA